MKKIFRRASAIAIAAVMAFGTVSVSAANVTAADDQSEESIVSEKMSEEETTEEIIVTGSDETVSDSAENENIASDSDEIQSVSETGASVSETGADEETGDEDLKTQEKTTESLTIGSGTTQDKNVPYTTYYKNGTTQILYSSTDMGNKDGTITEIAFDVANACEVTSSEINIYMMNMGNMYDFTDGADSNTGTLVYSGENVTLGSKTGWETIKLDKAYKYYSDSNLLVVITRKGPYVSNLTYNTSAVRNKTVYRGSDTDISYGEYKSDEGYTISQYRPNVKFTMEYCDHSYSKWVSSQLASCESSGFTTYKCYDCDRYYTLKSSNPLGHDFTNAETFTCDSEGVADENGAYYGMMCQRSECGYVKVWNNPDPCIWDGKTYEIWTKGSGTEDDPYLIETAANLMYLEQKLNSTAQHYTGKYFKLTNDLNLTADDILPFGYDLTHYFSGNFDGDGHSIRARICSTGNYGGLFGYCSGGTLENLIFKGLVYMYGDDTGRQVSFGGLIGYARNVTVLGCRNEADISCTMTSGTTYAGGLIGSTGDESAVIKNCSNTGAVTTKATTSYVAGIVGFAGESDISSSLKMEDCYNTGDITSKLYAGGLIGGNDSKNSSGCENCYNLGTISSSYKGGLIGYANNYASLKSCYYIDSSATNYYGKGASCCKTDAVAAKTESEIKSVEFGILMGEAYVIGTQGYPVLTWELPAGIPTITKQPEGGAVYKAGETAAPLTVEAESSEGYELLYQWYSCESDGTGAVMIINATESSYIPPTTEIGYKGYYCVVKAVGCENYPISSTTAVIKVWSGEDAKEPQINGDPKSGEYYQGDKAQAIEVTAVSTDDGILSYQWQCSDEENGEYTDIDGAISVSYTPVIDETGTKWYRCKVTNTREKVTSASAFSGAASIKVSACVISTAEELANFAQRVANGATMEGYTVTLTDDIDTSEMDYPNSVIIGSADAPFKGTFNGGGHTIKLAIETGLQEVEYIGLFARTQDAVIENLVLEGSVAVEIGTNVKMGALIGSAENTTIKNCGNNASVAYSRSGTGIVAGGLVGSAKNTSFYRCYNKADILVKGLVAGGIAGEAYGGVISDCYNTGKISAYERTGGIAGKLGGSGKMRLVLMNCYAAGKVSDGGGMITDFVASSMIIKNCYYDKSMGYGIADWMDGEEKDLEDYTTPPTAATADEIKAAAEKLNSKTFKDDIYSQNNGYPVLSWEWQYSGAITVSEQPSDAYVLEGKNVKYTVNAVASDGGEITYQWYYLAPGTSTWKKTSVQGNKTDTITLKATQARNGNYYRCVITDKNGCSITSRGAGITLVEEPKFIEQPESVTVKSGKWAAFAVKAQASNNSKLTYQWYYKAPGSKTWKKTSVNGYKTSAISMKATEGRDGNSYRCVITDEYGNTCTSEAATLTLSE